MQYGVELPRLPWELETVKRSALHRFVVLPKRWIVERTLAWVGDGSHHDPPPLLQTLQLERTFRMGS